MKRSWIGWAASSLAAAGVLGALMFEPDAMEMMPIDRTVFLPGETTDGHYQIELACGECHTSNFSDRIGMQEACVGCHGAELDLVDDSHPQRKFTDPRNADRVSALDARYCVTCHQEHRPEVTQTMGLSLPEDYCYRCHADVGKERPTHAELAFDSCATSGCHNFHDNRALYEDFLVDHRDDPMHWPEPRVPARDLLAFSRAHGHAGDRPLAPEDQDAPAGLSERARWVAEWAGTAHATAGVNCTDCHTDEAGGWVDAAPATACSTCHASESNGFLAGRHGMRLAAGLPAMQPGLARLPMHEDQAHAELGCDSCHAAHAYDTQHAAVDACLACHSDDHSLAYEASPHAEAWRAEMRGEAPSGSGVSCATCHLPRVEDERAGDRVLVAHNQNDFLRPGDKMIRASCLHCHGLGFSLDSLADRALIDANFRGQPAVHVDSIHFAAVLRWELEGKRPPWKEEKEDEK